MPELPEVHTTATGLQKVLPHLSITSVWTDYDSQFHKGKSNIKDTEYFKKFKSHVVGKKIVSVGRRAKNVLIHLSSGYTILVHMKMTGHLLYGKYVRQKGGGKETEKQKRRDEKLTAVGVWTAVDAGPLRDDPFNKWVHFVIMLSNGKSVALSDMRKFAKVTLIETKKLGESTALKGIGPEPLEKKFTFEKIK